ncbi:glycosyltransferase family 1 protein, partial [Salmonella enterica subsp. enterica serovar Typhi]|nr:glycosyltransferase family 1 protein [Salmonella enterica subsp. enterica serovar Typhi]
LIARMEAVIATSARTGSYLEVPYTVIRHGVDLERFHPPRSADETYAATGLPGMKAIGCFGRIRHQKGTDLFVDSMIALLPDYPEWTAIIAGRTTPEHKGFEDELRQRIAQAGLSERIRFIGEIWDVDIWYRRLSLYVAPSRTEGFGVTPLEAMASGVPTVASDAGAYTELIIEGETGAIVPTGKLEAFKTAIERFMADEPFRARCAERALTHMQDEFPISGEVQKLLSVYQRVRG